MWKIILKKSTISEKGYKNLKKIYMDLYIEKEGIETKIGDLSFIISSRLEVGNEDTLNNINDTQFKLFCLYLDYSYNLKELDFISNNNILFLNDIYIYEEYRCKNIGTKTIKLIEEICKSKNISKIYLHSCPIKRIKFSRSDKINLLNNAFKENKDRLDRFYSSLDFSTIDKENKKIELNYFYKNI